MTASLTHDLAVLDDRITAALRALRLARAASAHGGDPGCLRVEARAEAALNALLEYRHSVLPPMC
ncbi:hypothetical protein [Trujillonella endophytica]|uniref:Uncharacterized protein n=1 Tax=Trujillonella endophytica TaxID=673521 RepID=A0A1H8QN04_9ACTN|nr:hypothetical protein [Trujillella endophytica]SEO55609.1 hypothetical protein SAMN05660991_00700 [Trujillella endophytica]